MEKFKQHFIETSTRELAPGFDFGEVFDIYTRELANKLGDGFIEFMEEQLKNNTNVEELNNGTIQSDGPKEIEPILGDGEREDNTTGEVNVSNGEDIGEQGDVRVEEDEETDNNSERDDGEEELGNNGEEIEKINPEPDELDPDDFDDPNFPPEPSYDDEVLAE